jgi:hypothetical protein
MVPIVVLAAVALIYSYSQRYPIDRLIGIGIAGAFAGFVLFGVEVAVADQPKVPCWSEMHGSQFFRAMPYACQAATPAR